MASIPIEPRRLRATVVLCMSISPGGSWRLVAGAGLVGSEDLAVVGKRLELECVSRRVKEKHCVLLAGLARKSNVGFDHELDAVSAESVGQRLPSGKVEKYPEVRHWHRVAVDGVVAGDGSGAGYLMDH